MSLEEDIATLQALGPIEADGFIKGRFVLRIDLEFPAPMHARPAALDPFLERAAAIMGKRLAKYGAEMDFNGSVGRKARPADIAALGDVSRLMQASYDTNAAEITARRKQIEAATGKPTKDADFRPCDSGSLFLGDSLSVHESDTHIMLIGSGGWGVSLSFGLDLVADHQAEITALAQDILSSGIAASGIFGFAINTAPGTPPDMAHEHYLPPTRRFPMLNPLEPAACRFLPGVETGLMPIGCWYALATDTAKELGIDLAALIALEDQVHDVTRTANGYLVKLWKDPTLGDRHDDVDLSPATALARVLAMGMQNAKVTAHDGRTGPHDLGFLPVGTQADRWKFYRRFLIGGGAV